MMSKCIILTSGHVSCQDGKRLSSFFIENKSGKQLTKYEIDGCLVSETDPIKRCDFGVQADNVYWLVELKGGDFAGAVEQIASTFENCKFVPRMPITPVIVVTTSPIPAKRFKHLERLKKALGKHWSGEIKVGTKRVTISI